MSYICPICNGLDQLHVVCSKCSHLLDDHGKIDDLWGPYSPYREIDDLKLTNGFEDVKNHQCIHIVSCPHCGTDQVVSVNEVFQAE